MSTKAPSLAKDLHPGLPSFCWSVILIALLCASGCSDEMAAPSTSITGTSNPSSDQEIPQTTVAVAGIDAPPHFTGPRSVIAADRQLHISWDPARDDHTAPERITYRIYLAARSGKQDFDNPVATTSPGMTSHTLKDRANGEPIFLVVRAFDEKGQNDDNETEWPALPNPVLYVDGTAQPGGNGTTPQSAMRSIDEAIGEAIGLSGVNIHVAAGLYPEQLLLFEGMGIYGGFPTGFIAQSDPEVHRTELAGKPQRDVLILPPGQRLVVIDGIFFNGGGEARRAIVADDCQIRISRCQIHSFRDKGIQVETDRDDEGESTGTIHYCTFRNNGGDGIRVEGFIDLSLNNCTLIENGQSGLSVTPMVPRRGEKARIELNRCRISRNKDVGLSLRIDEPIGNDEDPARVRITLRGIVAQGNRDHGASFDVRYQENSPVDLRIRVEHSSFLENDRAGVHIDADAPGDFSIAHCSFLGNQGDEAILITGDSSSALTRIRSCLIGASAGFGVQLKNLGWLDVSRCLLIDNGGPAIFTADQNQLRARMWASSGIGAGPVGTRMEGAEMRPATDDNRPGFMTVKKAFEDGVQVDRPEQIPIPEQGFLFPPIGGERIPFQHAGGGRLLLADEDRSPVKENSVWLFSDTPVAPTWTEFAASTASRHDDETQLAAPPGLVFPGIPKLVSAPRRPLEVISLAPQPSILSSGNELSWNYRLTDPPSSVPEVFLSIDGKQKPVETRLVGEILQVTSPTEIPRGSRVRIEWDLESGSTDPATRISHEWLIAKEEGGG